MGLNVSQRRLCAAGSCSPDQVGPLRILGGVGPAPVTGQSVSCAPTDMSCHYFDPTAFAPVPAGQARFGTTGRNIIRGPGFFNLDASIFRDFDITEKVKFQIKAEMFSATNTPHYNNPGIDVTNPTTFSVITGTLNLAGRGTETGGERQTWFAAKLTFWPDLVRIAGRYRRPPGVCTFVGQALGLRRPRRPPGVRRDRL